MVDVTVQWIVWASCCLLSTVSSQIKTNLNKIYVTKYKYEPLNRNVKHKLWKLFFPLYIILPWPLYLQVLIFEAAHTFGLCLLVFKVLPNFDMIRALLLMCTSSIIPALLKLLLTKVCIHNCNIFSLFVESHCIMNTMTITSLRKYDGNIPEF